MDEENKNPPSLSLAESDEWTRLLEQSQITNVQSQPWHPHSTAFDDPASTPTIPIEEDETPTRPVTPSHIAVQDLTAIDGGVLVERQASAPAMAYAQLCSLLEKEDRSVCAEKSRCAVCGIDFTAANVRQRVRHFNGCWVKFRNTVERKYMDPVRPLCVSDPLASERNICTGGKEGADICVLCELSLEGVSAVDAFEHRILCQRARNSPPSACPRCDTRFTTEDAGWNGSRIAEHIYACSVHSETSSFFSLQAAWYERHSTRRDPSNCAFCSASQSHLDPINAFHHRRKCLEQKRPVYCPVCFDPLPCFAGEGTWTLGDVHWHVHNCQHNGKLSAIARDEFGTLEAQWAGRTQAVWRRFNENYGVLSGPRKGWTYKEHQSSYREKIARGRNQEAGLYLTPCSRLGSVVVCAEDGELREVMRGESRGMGRNRLEGFRRSAYEVYKMPDENMEPLDDKASVKACVEQLNPSVSSMVSLCTNGDEERGRPRIQGRPQLRTGRTTSGDRRWRRAVDKATRAGIRVPPGFELRSPAA